MTDPDTPDARHPGRPQPETSLQDAQLRSLHNSGAGTLVNGPVDSVINIHLGADAGRATGATPPEHEDTAPGSTEDDEPEDWTSPGAALFGALAAIGVCGYAFANVVGLAPADPTDPAPVSLPYRVMLACLASMWCLMAVSAALARAAEVFAEWADKAANAAEAGVQKHPHAAAANAAISGFAARLSRDTAVAAAAVAVLFGWFSFGRAVAERASTAQADADHSAQRAALAVHGRGES